MGADRTGGRLDVFLMFFSRRPPGRVRWGPLRTPRCDRLFECSIAVRFPPQASAALPLVAELLRGYEGAHADVLHAAYGARSYPSLSHPFPLVPPGLCAVLSERRVGAFCAGVVDRSLLGCSIGCLCLCRPQLSPSSGSTRRPTWASSNSSSRRRVRLEHHPVRRRTPPALRCPALSPPHNRITLPWRCCAPRCASEI